MTEKVTSDRRPLSDWKVNQLRVTTFFPNAPQTISPNCWEEMVGSPPDRTASKPKLGLFQSIGQFDGGVLIQSSQPDRCDWLLQPSESKDDSSGEEPNLGSFSDFDHAMFKLALNWFQKAPPVNRLALGVILHLPAESLQDSYKQLIPYLQKIPIDVKNSTDFFYQINRPRKSEVSGLNGLIINRLSKWSGVHVRTGNVVVRPESVTTTSEQVRSFTRLELVLL